VDLLQEPWDDEIVKYVRNRVAHRDQVKYEILPEIQAAEAPWS